MGNYLTGAANPFCHQQQLSLGGRGWAQVVTYDTQDPRALRRSLVFECV